MNKRKIQVVTHALALFVEQGIMETSIQDIIERAGISKGTFYNYFTSKNQCVSAVLEQVRYETRMKRSELQIGKRSDDRAVLIEQIAMISRNNQKHGLSAMFEEIFHSRDKEMKQYVIHYRMFEIDWLADRLIDVYGETLRMNAFEAAVIFFGIQQHLLFTAKTINQSHIDPGTVARSVFHYMDYIIESLIEKDTSVIDDEKLQVMKGQMTQEEVKQEEILQLLDESSGHLRFTKPQADLTTALRYEIAHQPLRESVVNALLLPYLDAFKGSTGYNQAKDIMSMVWRYMHQ
ncbi:TetR/AcrR family transcriptional regulator [Paenibacillus albidus]|uniref:TetR/AcrR family transcriptional regulator n=1 Tax=Paenibacillus albidus TaxID=2041023 RepID=UPI001BEC171A|nr:TetR/AcrR family transcriptional regulator [Paenibacillus albidus]MBT2290411.1 TetR/AcrR family transcriptional regulator [Paenibacillus albidus]